MSNTLEGRTVGSAAVTHEVPALQQLEMHLGIQEAVANTEHERETAKLWLSTIKQQLEKATK